MTDIKFHPDVLAAHAEFGGDLVSMQKCFDWYDVRAEIESLRTRAETAEKDRDSLQEHVYALMEKVTALSAHETCGCAWDKPDDLCMHHSPRLLTAEKKCEELEVALRDQFCPRPCNGRPDQFDVGDCVDAGECGCSAALAISTSKGETE